MKPVTNIMIGTAMDGNGGIATVVKGYSDADFIRYNHFVYVSSHSSNSGVFGNVTQFTIAFIKVFFTLAFKNVRIVHLHVASRGSFYRKSVFLMLAKVFKAKAVFHLHGAEFKVFYEQESGLFKKFFIVNSLKQADIIIVLSESWKQWVNDVIGDEKPVVVVYNSIPSNDLPSLSNRDRSILFLGKLEQRKGVYELLIAFKKVLMQLDDVRMLLCGNGNLQEYRTIAVQLGIAQNVDFKGWIGPEERSKYLAGSSMFVLPSFNEGFPMSIIEAMSYGMPIVSTNVGGIPEAIQDGKTGLLVSAGDTDALADAMLKFLNDPMLAQEFGLAAKSYFERNFSNEVCYPRIVSEVYKPLL